MASYQGGVLAHDFISPLAPQVDLHSLGMGTSILF